MEAVNNHIILKALFDLDSATYKLFSHDVDLTINVVDYILKGYEKL